MTKNFSFEGTSPKSAEISLKYVTIENEAYYMISNNDTMNPFFMSIVSDSNHWMFISSNGGLSAGRKDAENALFPYYTDDKITEAYDNTGSKSIFHVSKDNKTFLWEPFSERQAGLYNYTRNLYKNALGNKVLFEEVNHDLKLTFRYQWNSSNQFGFVRKSFLKNDNDTTVSVKLLDGIQNIMPYGVNPDLQAVRSNLVDAYKKSELEVDAGLGIFALSAIIVDRAEPSEALKANIVWSVGLDKPIHLLSSTQLDAFRSGEVITEEVDVKAKKGAYFISSEIALEAGKEDNWMILADVNQTASSVAEISHKICSGDDLFSKINEDIALGSERLKRLVSASDGIQLTADKKRNTRHYSNTLFNIMRGGIFDYNYQIENWDFKSYIKKASKSVYNNNQSLIEGLQEVFTFQSLREKAIKSDDPDFTRLALEYLPLKFSRRHGDPSRPWNKFSINTRNEIDGSKILDYEGNWRDIFQNWEALAHAYPEFIESMIFKFLNASTFDGYNPYRVTKDGFDWEIIEENDPWSYIGYWGDHQIIYLLKFLEFAQDHYPDKLAGYFSRNLFVYANVPYKIKSYEEILKAPKDTIVFDEVLDHSIRNKRNQIGSDGALIIDVKGNIHRVNLLEKLLATVLAKLSNFIPEGGIWLNTQRPEWNDANNALVGNGVSMVTLYYLRRFFTFMDEFLQSDQLGQEISVSEEMAEFYYEISSAFKKHQDVLAGSISDSQRKAILDDLGIAGSKFRDLVYKNNFSGDKKSLGIKDLQDFTELCTKYLNHSIKANRRKDGMYHAYNLMTVKNANEVAISYLDEMLEGQVAVLSSGQLTSAECLDVLNAMKASKLFREDQYSYLLYPNKELPRFTDKNIIPADKVKSSPLLLKLLEDGNNALLGKDINGKYHFNGNFNNADSLKEAMDELPGEKYGDLIAGEREKVLQIFEDVFNHKAFTGRSGTFFGYEGLGSIYWHMVSKLLLAVEECCQQAINTNQSAEIIGKLLEHYYEINEGIGVHKSPELYGAFPIDPYSHTPTGKGAQQPGMTGQVKEDILSRIGELGVFVKDGKINFRPGLLKKDEFLKSSKTFQYVDINQKSREIPLIANTLAFTYCQIPVIYRIAESEGIELFYINGNSSSTDELSLDRNASHQIFNRTGEIDRIQVNLKENLLK